MSLQIAKAKLKKSSALTAFIVFLVAIISAYGLGYQAGSAIPRSITVEELSNIGQPENSEPKVDFSIFWEVWDELRSKHPDFDKADKQALIYGAVSGLTDALGDPNTIFFSPEDSQRFGEDISGHFTGIGVK